MKYNYFKKINLINVINFFMIILLFIIVYKYYFKLKEGGVFKKVRSATKSVVNTTTNVANTAVDATTNVANTAVDATTNVANTAIDATINVAEEAAQQLAIQNALGKLIEPIKDLKTNILNSLKELKQF
jgi:hypothetical protein